MSEVLIFLVVMAACFSVLHVAYFKAMLREEKRIKAIKVNPAYLYWSERIMNCLHEANDYGQLVACQSILQNYKRAFPFWQAQDEFEAMTVVYNIKAEWIKRTTTLTHVPIQYTDE